MRKIRLIPKGFFSTSTGPQFHIFYTIMAAVTSCEKDLFYITHNKPYQEPINITRSTTCYGILTLFNLPNWKLVRTRTVSSFSCMGITMVRI